MTAANTHSSNGVDKLEFYGKILINISNNPEKDHTSFPGSHILKDTEPKLVTSYNTDTLSTEEIADKFLTYSLFDKIDCLIFETTQENVLLHIVSDSHIVTTKEYHKLLRNKLLARLQRLTYVDHTDKLNPQLGMLKISYRDKDYLSKILFCPHKNGDDIVIYSNRINSDLFH